MFERHFPSRILNDNQFIVGLTMTDFVVGIALFVGVSKLFSETPYGLIGLLVPFGFWACIFPIRHNYREKCLRDSLLNRLFRGRF